MKITKVGKVTIDGEQVLIEGFTFDSDKSGEIEYFTSEQSTYACASVLVLEWAEKRIAEARLQTADFSSKNNKLELSE